MNNIIAQSIYILAKGESKWIVFLTRSRTSRAAIDVFVKEKCSGQDGQCGGRYSTSTIRISYIEG